MAGFGRIFIAFLGVLLGVALWAAAPSYAQEPSLQKPGTPCAANAGDAAFTDLQEQMQFITGSVLSDLDATVPIPQSTPAPSTATPKDPNTLQLSTSTTSTMYDENGTRAPVYWTFNDMVLRKKDRQLLRLSYSVNKGIVTDSPQAFSATYDFNDVISGNTSAMRTHFNTVFSLTQYWRGRTAATDRSDEEFSSPEPSFFPMGVLSAGGSMHRMIGVETIVPRILTDELSLNQFSFGAQAGFGVEKKFRTPAETPMAVRYEISAGAETRIREDGDTNVYPSVSTRFSLQTN